MKVLTIGGATQDIYIEHEEQSSHLKTFNQANKDLYITFKSGEKIEIKSLIYHTGGGSTNSAVSFARLGFDTTCFCKIGNDHEGNAILENLQAEHVNTNTIVRSKDFRSGISFIMYSPHQDQTIFAYRGVNAHLYREEIPWEAIEQSDQLYITSLSDLSSELLFDIVKHAKKYHIPLATNPGSSQLAKGIDILKKSLPYIDTLILNSSEAITCMKSLIKNDANYKNKLEHIPNSHVYCINNNTAILPNLLRVPIAYKKCSLSIAQFIKAVFALGTKIVVITDGAYGVYVAANGEILFHPALKIKVVNTVGAGDAFGSCFIASLAKGYSVERALCRGMINSRSVLSYLGAKTGLLTEEELEKEEKKISPKLILRFKL